VEDLAPLLADGAVRLVALTAVSNALGLRTPVAAAAALARAHGAHLMCDAVHGAPHELPDVRRDGVDFLLFSPYKVCAPHAGVLFVAREAAAALDIPRLFFKSGAEVASFEHGTPPYEALAGWLAALRYLASDVGRLPEAAPITRAALEAAYGVLRALEAPVAAALVAGLAATPRVQVYGSTAPADRVGTVAFRVEGLAPEVVAERLARQHNICVSSGHFYAIAPIEALGLLQKGGVVRASIAHYNTPAEVQKLVQAVGDLAREAGKSGEA
jgi:selenocysteine lyase/cysteine desulfurase